MTIEEVVYELLTSTSAVRLTLGDRLYPGQAPESAEFPLAVYSDAETVPAVTHDGAGNTDRHAMEIAVWALDYATAKRAARAVRKIHGYRGVRHGLRVQGIFLRSEADQHEPPMHAEERGVFGVLLSFDIYFRPAEQGVTHGG